MVRDMEKLRRNVNNADCSELFDRDSKCRQISLWLREDQIDVLEKSELGSKSKKARKIFDFYMKGE